MGTLTDEELTRFGIDLTDEGPHPFDPAETWWNESWFWDWYDTDGTRAGHCRVGMFPAQKRLWFWLFVYENAEWLALEQQRLDLADFDASRLAYDRAGLAFSWDADEPLRRGRLRVDGFGRVVSGARAGLVLPVSVDLEVSALGPAHTFGRATGAGHESDQYDASRFEQPIAVSGEQGVGGGVAAIAGRGERDHSWGPRNWAMEWTFLVANGEDSHLQCVIARLPGVGVFPVGYLAIGGEMASLVDVDLDVDHGDELVDSVGGRFLVRDDLGRTLGGEIELVSAHEIDLTHCLVPPRRSVYRRNLVRVRTEDGPVIGWLEDNHFLPGDPVLD